MKNKIKKITEVASLKSEKGLEIRVNQIEDKINEIIDHLNSQSESPKVGEEKNWAYKIIHADTEEDAEQMLKKAIQQAKSDYKKEIEKGLHKIAMYHHDVHGNGETLPCYGVKDVLDLIASLGEEKNRIC